MERISLSLVVIALLVTAPRLTLAFIIGDGVTVPSNIEVSLLVATGIGSGIVLTVGNAVIAHALARKSRQKGMLWWVLLIAWLAFLMSALILVTPPLVYGFRESKLVTVMPSGKAQWIWAITAVAVVEVLVGASIVASILEKESDVPQPKTPGAFSRIGAALIQRIEHQVALDPQPAIKTVSGATERLTDSEEEEDVTRSPAPMTNNEKKRQRHHALIELQRNGEELDVEAFADKFGVSKQTIYRDVKEIQELVGESEEDES